MNKYYRDRLWDVRLNKYYRGKRIRKIVCIHCGLICIDLEKSANTPTGFWYSKTPNAPFWCSRLCITKSEKSTKSYIEFNPITLDYSLKVTDIIRGIEYEAKGKSRLEDLIRSLMILDKQLQNVRDLV